MGGVPGSFHIKGRAVDWIASPSELREAASVAWAQRVGSACTGPEEVLHEYPGGQREHLHTAW